MKKYKITFDPVIFTNEFPKKTVEVSCKKPNIKELIKELYNRDVKNIIKQSNSKYIADDIVVYIEKG